ncbi:MAG TPA: methyltransferase domain-containing protein [Candidatus Limnocylindrales bacterium]|nr:methyltransferase domain-containing protein [Candidatus Limnocylindrales bacterium]
MTETHATLPERIVQLLNHLGLARAHFAACMPRDWEGLAAYYPELIASLTLICPMGINASVLQTHSLPVLCVTGDRGRPAKEAERELAKLPAARAHVLRDYFSPPWADPILDRRDEIGKALVEFISPIQIATLASAPIDGEVAELSYRICGQGAPLVLMPLALSPSQWEPLISALSANFCTITLGGAHLGMVAHLETRAQSSYMRVIDQLISELNLAPGQSVLEVGCGPGAIVRRLALRTQGANKIVGVDMNQYLLREAAALARRDKLDRFIEFQTGDAERLPFPDDEFDATISCTVMEEGDADRMLAEFVRVTKRGGKVGAVVRSTDLPRWVNLPLSNPLKHKVDSAGFFGGNVTDGGCADASLYRRFTRTGLANITMMPQWANHKDGERLQYLRDRIESLLRDAELSEWRRAVGEAQKEGTFFISEPFHCAVGTK